MYDFAYPTFSSPYTTLYDHLHALDIHDELLAFCIETIAITPVLDLHSEIIAVIPFNQDGQTRTVVFFTDKVQVSDHSSLTIINQWLHSFNLDYSHYHDLYQSFRPQKNYTIPVSDGRYSLFPLENIHHKEAAWINAGQINELHKQSFCTQIEFTNGLRYDVEKQIPSLEQQIRRAIGCHLLFRPIQRIFNYAMPQPLTILEYLHLPSTTVTRKSSRLLPFSLDLEQENHLRLSYFGMTQEYHYHLEQKAAKKSLSLF